MPKAKPRTLLTSLYLSAAALIFLPAALPASAEETNVPETVEESPVTPSPFVYGMRVWIDPETGAFRQPSRAEREAVAEKRADQQDLNKSSEGLVVEYRKDGSRFVDLQGRFLHSLVLTRAEDGTLTLKCDDKSHERGSNAAPAGEAAER